MARYDKYDPISGGFRALLAADWLSADVAKPIGVGLDANGRAVKGKGNSGITGVLVLDKQLKAGVPVDIMTSGEIVDCTGLAAGTEYFAADAGTIGTVNTDTKVGHTVESTRLVVRCAGTLGA